MKGCDPLLHDSPVYDSISFRHSSWSFEYFLTALCKTGFHSITDQLDCSYVGYADLDEGSDDAAPPRRQMRERGPRGRHASAAAAAADPSDDDEALARRLQVSGEA